MFSYSLSGLEVAASAALTISVSVIMDGINCLGEKDFQRKAELRRRYRARRGKKCWLSFLPGVTNAATPPTQIGRRNPANYYAASSVLSLRVHDHHFHPIHPGSILHWPLCQCSSIMASAWCWNCLSRLRPTPRALPSPSSATPRIASAPFHSTAVQFALPPKKKSGVPAIKYRQGQVLRRKKKPKAERGRPPAPGERKALRKRIVLSNPNALEVQGMQDLSPETMVDARLRGSVLGLPVPMLDQLRAVQAFKPKQGWSLFRRPGTVLRRDTLEMGRLFEKISGDGDAPEKGKVVTKVITGLKGSGKTVHLLQAMAMGFLKKWVVITVPDGMFAPIQLEEITPPLTLHCSTGSRVWRDRLCCDRGHKPNAVRPASCDIGPVEPHCRGQQ